MNAYILNKINLVVSVRIISFTIEKWMLQCGLKCASCSNFSQTDMQKFFTILADLRPSRELKFFHNIELLN